MTEDRSTRNDEASSFNELTWEDDSMDEHEESVRTIGVLHMEKYIKAVRPAKVKRLSRSCSNDKWEK